MSHSYVLAEIGGLQQPCRVTPNLMSWIIIACCLMHNFIRATMIEDPIDNEVANNRTQPANDHDNVINTVEASQGWTDRRDNLANEMFIEWNARSMEESNAPKGPGKNKRQWIANEDEKLIDALMELHVSGKYSGADNGFKPEYYKAVQQLLDDSKTCFVDAEDKVWTDYYKTHKGVANFKGKPLPFYEKLCTIFGKDRATRSQAIDHGDDDVVQERHPLKLT
ncbi:hypothetical protein Tco_0885496 [Tanacetum coccineum]